MAYTFPLALNQFFDGLPIETVTFDLPEALESSETGKGEILTADLGDRLWRADVNFHLGYYGQIEALKAKLHMLRYAGRSLLIHSMPLKAPQADPSGSILGASAPILAGIASNNREIGLANLPAGYKISAGDFVSWEYGANPTRYALHQFVDNATVDNNGHIGLVEVTPFIAHGTQGNIPVRLIKPIMKAVVVPGSFKAGTSGGGVTSGVSVSFIQTFR